jgi:single-strand DNA-binding protein
MSDQYSVTGLVATTPRHLVTQDGLPITSFRLAASLRKFDRQLNRWVEAETNWFTITSFRQLAVNSAVSVSKGDRVVVMGRLRVRDWDNGERAGTSVEIEAETIGHDMLWGSSTFVRTVNNRELDPESQPAPEEVEDQEVQEPEVQEPATKGKTKATVSG